VNVRKQQFYKNPEEGRDSSPEESLEDYDVELKLLSGLCCKSSAGVRVSEQKDYSSVVM
jgi:hypothetical protein